jgi:hypothetical protein
MKALLGALLSEDNLNKDMYLIMITISTIIWDAQASQLITRDPRKFRERRTHT